MLGTNPFSRRAPRDRSLTARFAALDLGTNNCRLLIAAPAGNRGFQVVDSYSQIVRLGEGLAETGRLSPAAMTRALRALSVCAERIDAQKPAGRALIATEACRRAANGAAFLARVHAETGLSLRVITPEEEADLAAASCADLIDPTALYALIVDIGGGSTEISIVAPPAPDASGRRHQILATRSFPLGVVGLSERHGQSAFAAIRAEALDALSEWGEGRGYRDAFAADRAHLIGTSGTATSLAGAHLRLPRYRREAVDGLWLGVDAVRQAGLALTAMSVRERARVPAIGRARADLIVAGYAILAAALEIWPAQRLRVADRGLREGLLLSMIAAAEADQPAGA